MPTFLLAYFLLCFACLATTENLTGAKKWAVLVAGSNGWYNYRHQANVARAYHLLRNHGIPASQIITFAYDDIANNVDNPYPGKIFSDYSQKDYYKGLVIDYKGMDVTPNMLNLALKGNARLKKRGFKVIESGPNDHVLLYFSDHGAPGIFVFPDDELTAVSLNKTITYMYERKMYKKLVIYLEACDSGSMFKDILSPNINAFTVSSAMENQSTYAVFCEDSIMGTCLSDEFSYNWLSDSEKHDLRKFTLQQEFAYTKEKMRKSIPQEYGDMSLGNMTVSEFQGDKNTTSMFEDYSSAPSATDHVPSRSAHIHGMMKSLMRASSAKEQDIAKRRLIRAIKLGELAEETMNLVIEAVNLKASERMTQSVDIVKRLACFEEAYKSFKRRCFSIQRVPEVAKEVNKLQILCQNGFNSSNIIAAIEKTCH